MLNFVPEDWMIGTLGIIPLILGIRAIFTDDDEADEAVEQIEGAVFNPYFGLLA